MDLLPFQDDSYADADDNDEYKYDKYYKNYFKQIIRRNYAQGDPGSLD